MGGDALDVGDCLCLASVREDRVEHVAHGGGVDIVCVGAVEGEPPSATTDASWTFAAACSAVRHRDEPLKGTVKQEARPMGWLPFLSHAVWACLCLSSGVAAVCLLLPVRGPLGKLGQSSPSVALESLIVSWREHAFLQEYRLLA